MRCWEHRGDHKIGMALSLLEHTFTFSFLLSPPHIHNRKTHKRESCLISLDPPKSTKHVVSDTERERESERKGEKPLLLDAREKTPSFCVVSQNKGPIFVIPCSKIPCPPLNAHIHIHMFPRSLHSYHVQLESSEVCLPHYTERIGSWD